METANKGCTALLILSDGQENRSRHSWPELRRYLLETNVAVYAIAFEQIPTGVKAAALAQVRNGLNRLAEMAALTGGRSFVIREQDDAAAAGRLAARALRERYVLAISASRSGPGGWRKITVHVREPHARLSYRRSYRDPGGER